MTTIKRLTINVREDMEKLENADSAGEKGKWCSSFGIVWQVFKKLNMEFLCALTIPLRIYTHSRDWETCHTVVSHEYSQQDYSLAPELETREKVWHIIERTTIQV